jgi:hypothetical protein
MWKTDVVFDAIPKLTPTCPELCTPHPSQVGTAIRRQNEPPGELVNEPEKRPLRNTEDPSQKAKRHRHSHSKVVPIQIIRGRTQVGTILDFIVPENFDNESREPPPLSHWSVAVPRLVNAVLKLGVFARHSHLLHKRCVCRHVERFADHRLTVSVAGMRVSLPVDGLRSMRVVRSLHSGVQRRGWLEVDTLGT